MRRTFRPDLAVARKVQITLPGAALSRWLLWPALALLLAAAMLFLGGGYHAGFATLNGLMPLVPPVVWAVLTEFGDTAVALCLLLVLLPGRWYLAWTVLIASVFGTAFTHVFKGFWPALRPSGLLSPDSFHSVGALTPDQSFPSGHSQTALTLAGFVMVCCPAPWARALALAGGLAAALSRVPVGMHWPIDTLVGAAGGLVCVWLGLEMARRLPQGTNLVVVGGMTGLSLLAAVLLMAGHPPANPLAHGVMALVGALSLLAFAGQVAREALRRAKHRDQTAI
ncbi:phosphatase PAP2 family protein [Fluviibacterium sp. DFM31]|uniref:Phosphatase PAP2 family protein n=1 Tax=Meridianimarinicoccus marinus TaxID=3231483 RepID=A0ABV3L4R7_9RHOB